MASPEQPKVSLTKQHVPLTVAAPQPGGFSVFQLALVIAIIVGLIAIAIPTFEGQRREAIADGIKSNLRKSFVAASSYSVEHQGSFKEIGAEDLTEFEPDLQVLPLERLPLQDDPESFGQVYMQTSATNSLLLCSNNDQGDVTCLARNSDRTSDLIEFEAGSLEQPPTIEQMFAHGSDS